MKWKSIHNSRPEPGEPFFAKTRNGKNMACTGEFNPRFQDRQMNDHFIDKFGITHWLPVPIELEEFDPLSKRQSDKRREIYLKELKDQEKIF